MWSERTENQNPEAEFDVWLEPASMFTLLKHAWMNKQAGAWWCLRTKSHFEHMYFVRWAGRRKCQNQCKNSIFVSKIFESKFEPLIWWERKYGRNVGFADRTDHNLHCINENTFFELKWTVRSNQGLGHDYVAAMLTSRDELEYYAKT